MFNNNGNDHITEMFVIWNTISSLPSLYDIAFWTDSLCFLITFLLLSQQMIQYWIAPNECSRSYSKKLVK